MIHWRIEKILKMRILKTEKDIKLLTNIALLILIAGALLKIWHYDIPGIVVAAIGIALWFIALVFKQNTRKKNEPR